MNSKEIIQGIKEKQGEIKSVIFVGCGASKADLYPAKYFLDGNAKALRVSHYTANEFNYATPEAVNDKSIVITASLGGTTPETVQANARAKELGAHVISLTRTVDSPLTKDADYVVYHRFAESYSAKLEKMGFALELAVEILQQFEGYDNYEDMQLAFSKIYDLADTAAKSAILDAKKFANEYKDSQ
ncbi:SIS domain-containing protein [Clostridium sartagoforme]|uniref:SIS domain-containing protein n=1 Tax=Clostridium sartagoforme TaxID=84031 RepID=UPI00039FD738|nr:SIS domain-containing protein [Clostridium sartagoforme]